MSVMLEGLTLEFIGTPIVGPEGKPGKAGDPGPKGDPGDATIMIDDEIPIGEINGINYNFTSKKLPIPGTMKVYSDGLRLIRTIDPNVPRDYTIVGQELTLVTPPTTTLVLDYRTEEA